MPSLADLVNSLPKLKLHETQKHFPQERIELFHKKSVYPYEYLDSEEKFDDTCLPPLEMFFNKLTQTAIKAEEYQHAQTVRTATFIALKAKWPDRDTALLIEKIFDSRRAVFSLEDLGCPRREWIASGHDSCLHHLIHAPGFFCTQKASRKLADWCDTNGRLLDMDKTNVREKTFFDWEADRPSAKDMADAGMVRLQTTKDSAKCVYCRVIFYKWEKDDKPLHDHGTESPFCKFVRYRKQSTSDGAAIREDVCGLYKTRIDEADLCSICHA